MSLTGEQDSVPEPRFTREGIPAGELNRGSSAYQHNTLHGPKECFTSSPKPDQNIRVEPFHITQEFAVVQSAAVEYLGRHARDAYERRQTTGFFPPFFFFYTDIARWGVGISCP